MRRKSTSKTRLVVTLVSFISCALIGSLLFPDSIRGSCRINDISLEKVDNFTQVSIYAEKPFEFVHSTLEAKDEKPYRVVIDCKDAIHDLPQHNFRRDLPPGTIRAIRTSQFQTEPERIVRIVLDLDKPGIYKVVEKGENRRGTIAILTAQDSEFALWTARKRERAASGSKLASSVSLENTTMEISEPEDDFLTSTEKRSHSSFEQSKSVDAKEAKKTTAFERSLSFADTSQAETQRQVSQISPVTSETERKDSETLKQKSEETADKVVLASGATSEEVFSVPKPDHTKLQLQQIEQETVEPDVKEETPESPSHLTSASTKNSRSMGPTAEKQIEKTPPSTEERTVSSPGETHRATGPATGETETASPILTSKDVEPAVTGGREESPKEMTESPESLVVVSRPKGTAVGAIPARETIYYQSEGRRDPFAPLTERISTQLGEIPLPTFESLKLVGILRDEAGNRALLEDDRGYGYIMKNGDKIKNGHVISVEDNKVVFHVQEYGWSRTIALELFNRISKAR